MNMIGTMLRGMGVEIDEATLNMLSQLLPQLPDKVNEVVSIVNKTIQNFDERLRFIEIQLIDMRKDMAEARHGIAFELEEKERARLLRPTTEFRNTESIATGYDSRGED